MNHFTRVSLGINLRIWQFGFGVDWSACEHSPWYAWASFGPFCVEVERFFPGHRDHGEHEE